MTFTDWWWGAVAVIGTWTDVTATAPLFLVILAVAYYVAKTS